MTTPVPITDGIIIDTNSRKMSSGSGKDDLNMQPRRPHHKSRNGCMQCKKRKIKCDETSPSCGPCIKHRVSCSYSTNSTTPASSASAPTTPPRDLGVDAYISPSRLLDLKLLHNFGTSTIPSITPREEERKIYYEEIIPLSFTYPYLLHGILAVSAFHLVTQLEQNVTLNCPTPPSDVEIRDYLLAANAHYNTALQSLRQNITEITRENCHAMFACSLLIFMASSARPKTFLAATNGLSTLHADHTIDRIMEWMYLIRGIKSIVVPQVEWIREGPLSCMIKNEIRQYDEKGITEESSIHLDKLSAFLPKKFSSHSSKVCQDAIVLLRQTMAGVIVGEDPGYVFLWAVLVSDDYLRLLSELKPEALLVLAIWASQMYKEEYRWWISGWSSLLAHVVDQNLSEEFRPWIERPWKWMDRPINVP